MAAKEEPCIDDLFQDIGNKLGWFDHGSLTDAIKHLSIKSEKKKSRVKSKKADKKSSNSDHKENQIGGGKNQSKSKKDVFAVKHVRKKKIEDVATQDVSFFEETFEDAKRNITKNNYFSPSLNLKCSNTHITSTPESQISSRVDKQLLEDSSDNFLNTNLSECSYTSTNDNDSKDGSYNPSPKNKQRVELSNSNSSIKSTVFDNFDNGKSSKVSVELQVSMSSSENQQSLERTSTESEKSCMSLEHTGSLTDCDDNNDNGIPNDESVKCSKVSKQTQVSLSSNEGQHSFETMLLTESEKTSDSELTGSLTNNLKDEHYDSKACDQFEERSYRDNYPVSYSASKNQHTNNDSSKQLQWFDITSQQSVELINSSSDDEYFTTMEDLPQKSNQFSLRKKCALKNSNLDVENDIDTLDKANVDDHLSPRGMSVASDTYNENEQYQNGKEAKLKPVFKESSDSSDDDFEAFLTKVKTPARKSKPISDKSLEEFVISDSDSSDGLDDSVFYIKTTNLMKRVDENIPLSKRLLVKNIPSTFKTSSLPDTRIKTSVTRNKDTTSTNERKPVPAKINDLPIVWNQSTNKPRCKSEVSKVTASDTYGFLKSLATNIADEKRDLTARRYVKHFVTYKEDLTDKLFKLYNETVFENKLSSNFEVKWNKRLLKTAGFCAYKKTASKQYTARIELSDKVCDTAERLRDTLIHEMCHAAVWLINNANDGHGPLWKYWAKKANYVHKDLPVIKRCHSYDIATKYTYQCSKCSYQFGRHSKSLDVTKKVCGYCRGSFELLVNKKDGSVATPRKLSAPNKFAMFVKENYGSVKKTSDNLTHKEVMNLLSEKFAKSKIT